MQSKNRQLLLVGLLCIGLSAFPGFAIFMDPDSIAVWSLTVLLFFQVSIPFARLSHPKEDDPLNFLVLISFMYFLHFVARPVFLLFNPDEMMRFGPDAEALLANALLYTNIGFASLLIGYHSFAGCRLANYLPPLACKLRKGRLFNTIVLLYAVGLLMRLIVFSKGWHLRYASGAYYGEVSAWFRVIDYLAVFSLYGFLLATLYVFYTRYGRTNLLPLWYLMLGIEFTSAVLGGSKFALLFAFLAPLMAWRYRQMRMKVWPLLAASVAFIIIAFPFLTVYRASIDYEVILGGGYTAALGALLPAVASSFLSNPWVWVEQVFVQVLTRFHGIVSMMAIIAGVPDLVDYQHGKTLLGAIASLVPTFLWPAKDEAIISAGYLMAWQIWNLGTRAGAGIGSTQIGELYMNFGMLGVITGMFVLGAFYRFTYTYLIERQMHFMSLFLYIYMVYWMLPVDFDFQLAYGNLIKQMLFFLLPIVWFLNGGQIFERRQFAPRLGQARVGGPPVLRKQVDGKL
ncbi:MAG: O-antigen polysaccharide polymerase Wzy [Candidatus Binatia bacterium]